MIMHPREILEAFLSLSSLPIDKVWFKGYTEKQLEYEIAKFIDRTEYTSYILISDDVIVTPQALQNLLEYSEHPIIHEVVTGWCNIFPGYDLSNVELKPWTEENSGYLRARSMVPDYLTKYLKRLYRAGVLKSRIDRMLYDHFARIEDVWSQPAFFRTWFVGWALTSMSRDLWIKYPFQFPEEGPVSGHGSDRMMSIRLGKAGIPMMCARDSFVYHLATERDWIVGKKQPSVRLELQERKVSQETRGLR